MILNPKYTLLDSTMLCGKVCIPAKPIRHQAGFADQVVNFFTNIFQTHDWPPRWYCGNWTDFHGWLYIISDLGIWAAYFAIPILLLRLIRKRRDIPFSRIFWLFIAFILLCGLTHLVDAIIFWWPAYRLSALVRLATAVVSLFTVYGLYKVLPSVFTLRSVTELEAEIEKRRIVEEKLAASEFLLSEASRISRVGGWEYDIANQKRTWSKTIYDIYELPYDHPIDNVDVLPYFAEPYRKKIAEAIDKGLKSGTRWDMELVLVTAKKSTIWVRSIGEALFDNNGKIVKLRGVFMDINKYKTTESALNKAWEITQQSNQQLNSFTHILSHNIRNHANNITLLSSLVNKEKLDGENLEIFTQINNVSDGLNDTLDSLSEVIKVKEAVINPENLSFTEIANNTIKIFDSELSLAQAEVNFSFNVEEVQFPRIYLESILTNLISNAIKYKAPDRNLVIQLKTYQNKNKCTVLECIDNGLGIDLSKYGDKLFGLYETFHGKKNAHGVGLFLVKTQIESQGGRIAVDSTPGTGTTFKITFTS